jgi:hypothetical protein
MALEQFAECFAGRVERTVDDVLADLQQLGTENLQAFLTWFRGLSDADRALFLALASIANAVILKILTKAIGQAAGAAIIAFVGGASWALLARACLECSDQL